MDEYNYNDIILYEKEKLIEQKWKKIINAKYPNITKENKNKHRTDIKEIRFIDEIKKVLLEKLGFFPIFVFLTQYLHKIDLPGPYRLSEKGLLLLYQLVQGKSINEMNDYIPSSSYHRIYLKFYKYYQKDLKEFCNLYLYTDMFSNIQIRVLNAKINNPLKLKNITLMLDGYDSKISYQDINFDKKRLYSYKFKSSGLRTQFVIDTNNFIIYVSKSLPCADYTDGQMLERIPFNKFYNIIDCILIDGGYPLHLENTIEINDEKGVNINIENFCFPFRKSKNIELIEHEQKFNKEISSMRSQIESFFHDFTILFKKFNKRISASMTESNIYHLQFSLSSILYNIKNLTEKYDINLHNSEYYKLWISEGFDFFSHDYINSQFNLPDIKLYKQEHINNKNNQHDSFLLDLIAKFKNEMTIINENNIEYIENNDVEIIDSDKENNNEFNVTEINSMNIKNDKMCIDNELKVLKILKHKYINSILYLEVKLTDNRIVWSKNDQYNIHDLLQNYWKEIEV